MVVIKSDLLCSQPEIIFGFSTRNREEYNTPPYYFNLSLSVGDDRDRVLENRVQFAKRLGLTWEQVALQKQIHSDIVNYVDSPGYNGESDAIVTDKYEVGLAASSGDCCTIYLYDKKHQVISAVHSGWRGTQKKILEKTLSFISERWNSEGQDIFAYIAPSITQNNYEIGMDVAKLFPDKYINNESDKLFLDITSINKDMLLNFGIPSSQIEVSPLCSYKEEALLHSYRRDGQVSGRAYGIICMRRPNV